MKALKYLLITICGLIGGLFPLFDVAISSAETAPLDENLEPLAHIFIPDMAVFVEQTIIGLLVGLIIGWILWLCFLWLRTRMLLK